MGAINIQSHLNLIGDNPININDFQILNFIASGGFSKVYKVKFKKSGRIFALKQISKSKIKKNYINFVFSEKEILSDLYNPFLINLYCTFQDQYNLYYIMDYLGGGDLRYYLLKKKKFNENQIKFILGCVIVSLEYIHSKKIIHRDIKPENLIFDDKVIYIYVILVFQLEKIMKKKIFKKLELNVLLHQKEIILIYLIIIPLELLFMKLFIVKYMIIILIKILLNVN